MNTNLPAAARKLSNPARSLMANHPLREAAISLLATSIAASSLGFQRTAPPVL
jgi:hypothetical protein